MTTGLPDISVVIPARNAAQTLGDQLAALARQSDGSFEVIVVDNASDDLTLGIAQSFASSIPLSVVSEPRRGVNSARNTGIDAARGSKILLCDADDVVGDRWVHSLAASLREGVWVRGRNEVTQLNSTRTIQIRHRSVMGRQDVDQDGPLIGCNCGFMRSDWERVGGFDERLSGWGDEVEFFERMKCTGLLGVFEPDAVVHYRLRPGMRSWVRDHHRGGRSHEHAMQIGLGAGIAKHRARVARLILVAAHAVILLVDGWLLHRRARHLGAIAYHLGRISQRSEFAGD